MKKKLNTDVIANELEGASLFFTKIADSPSLELSTTENLPTQTPRSPKPNQAQESTKHASKKGNTESRVSTTKVLTKKKDKMHASVQASNNASMHANNHSFKMSLLKLLGKR